MSQNVWKIRYIKSYYNFIKEKVGVIMGKFALINRLWVKRNSKGSAIMLVLFVFVFLMITATTVLSIHGNNLRQAKKQEQSMEAYYLAYSGCEIGWQALLAEQGELKKKIKDEMGNSNLTSWGPQTFTIDKNSSISRDYLDGGEIIVEIQAEAPLLDNGKIDDKDIKIYINSRGIYNGTGNKEIRDLCLWVKEGDLTFRQYSRELYNSSITP